VEGADHFALMLNSKVKPRTLYKPNPKGAPPAQRK